MILARDPDMRRLAARILLVQMAATLVIAALCLLIWGLRHGLSALAGGSIGVIANLYMTMTALRPGRGAGQILGRLAFGQMMKIGLTVALFVIVARTGWAAWPPLVTAYIATLVVFWFVPAYAATRMSPPTQG